MSNRCTNCGKYPFCENIEEASIENDCLDWTKRDVTILDNVEEGYFKFRKI